MYEYIQERSNCDTLKLGSNPELFFLVIQTFKSEPANIFKVKELEKNQHRTSWSFMKIYDSLKVLR